LVINLQNFGVDQNYIQRYHAASSEREARKSLWLGGLLYLPVSAVFFFIGTALFAYYTARPEDLAPAYQAVDKADFVFPYFIVTVLPPGITGLLIAAIFSAAMSTISTSLNSSATVLLDDYYRRYVNPAADERQGMRVLRWATVVWAGLALVIALLMSTFVRNALDASWLLAGIFSGGMLGLFLLGFLVTKATTRCATLGMIAGIGTIAWMTISPHWDSWPEVLRSPFHHFLTIVFGTGAVLLTGAAATLFFDRGSRDGHRNYPVSRSDSNS
jgi:solute:Na+ symporter, SSS family